MQTSMKLTIQYFFLAQLGLLHYLSSYLFQNCFLLKELFLTVWPTQNRIKRTLSPQIPAKGENVSVVESIFHNRPRQISPLIRITSKDPMPGENDPFELHLKGSQNWWKFSYFTVIQIYSHNFWWT